jgi:ferredoxin
MSINIPVSGASQSNEIYSLRVNGQVHHVKDAWIGESLLYVLRERLGLPGAKGACEQGECGSCTVLLDGDAVSEQVLRRVRHDAAPRGRIDSAATIPPSFPPSTACAGRSRGGGHFARESPSCQRSPFGSSPCPWPV